jgi:hypothetical protein
MSLLRSPSEFLPGSQRSLCYGRVVTHIASLLNTDEGRGAKLQGSWDFRRQYEFPRLLRDRAFLLCHTILLGAGFLQTDGHRESDK